MLTLIPSTNLENQTYVTYLSGFRALLDIGDA
jgi:hypothetical protein